MGKKKRPPRPKPIEWRPLRHLAGADAVFRESIALGLVKQVEGYEGDYALHVLSDGQLVLVVRDQDKRVVVYDCRIERYGISQQQAEAEEPTLVRRIPLKDWF